MPSAKHQAKSAILEKLPTISAAIRTLVISLDEFSKKPYHRIDMDTFGEVVGDICYGCASTALVLHCWPDLPIAVDTRWLNDGPDQPFRDSLADFECCINAFRQGLPEELLAFYRSTSKITPELRNRMNHLHLSNRNWRREIPKAMEIAGMLEAKGL